MENWLIELRVEKEEAGIRNFGARFYLVSCF